MTIILQPRNTSIFVRSLYLTNTPRSMRPTTPGCVLSLSVTATLFALTSSFSSNMTPTKNQSQAQQQPLASLTQRFDHSWIKHLSNETPPKPPSSNKSMRPVKNGHYVHVNPTPLRNPRLVAYSTDMASRLRLEEDDVCSDAFLKYFSGDVDSIEGAETWATPYALSIMGQRYTSNCPYGTGDGYGDGRAISIGEVWIPSSSSSEDEKEDNDESNGHRYEFQLKGGGTTPFCRGADGRAVLRSSIREFLASESIHFLGISTTRALSLIVSDDADVSKRPWYSDHLDGVRSASSPQIPSLDDPRLAMFPLEKRQTIIQQLRKQKRDPDIMIEEPNAITTRVAPSFLRVGHVDLFARRAQRAKMENRYDGVEYGQLEDIIWHAAFREYYEEAYKPYRERNDLRGCCMALLRRSADTIAAMVAGWIRVGFCQGNFNADNCLVAGRTMDYGPFGFMEEYNPVFAKWTGSGEHFGFLNQPTAGFVNYMVLVESVLQVLRKGDDDVLQELEEVEQGILERAKGVFQNEVNRVWRAKLGFDPEDGSRSANEVWQELEPLLRESRADWTLFWRQLTYVARDFDLDSEEYEDMVKHLVGNQYAGYNPFYQQLSTESKQKFIEWMQLWREKLRSSSSSEMTPYERMRTANPKYILREWMLVDAYTKASQGDESIIAELLELIQRPYEEGTKEEEEKYYRRAEETDLMKGGTAFMS